MGGRNGPGQPVLKRLRFLLLGIAFVRSASKAFLSILSLSLLQALQLQKTAIGKPNPRRGLRERKQPNCADMR